METFSYEEQINVRVEDSPPRSGHLGREGDRVCQAGLQQRQRDQDAQRQVRSFGLENETYRDGVTLLAILR